MKIKKCVEKYNLKVKQARVKMALPKDNYKLKRETSKCSKKFLKHTSTNQYAWACELGNVGRWTGENMCNRRIS